MLQVAPAGCSFPAVEHGAGGRADDDARKADGESPALAGRGSNADARTVLTGTTHSQSEGAAEAAAAPLADSSGRASESPARKASGSGGVHLCATEAASVPIGVPLIKMMETTNE